MISLHANLLTSLHPKMFASLKHLEVLKLSENLLTSLDDVLIGLVSLQILSVNHNLLHHVSAETFKGLNNLQRLELASNQLTHFEPGTFRYNPNLVSIILASNPVRSFDKLFTNESMLHFLNISDCQLVKFPTDLPQTIQFLTLSKNNINEIHKSDTLNYVNLHSLILEGNNISFVENDAFLHTRELTSLYLYVNSLREIPGPFTQNIKRIYLDDNLITGLPPDMFLPGTQLEILSLKNNNINTLTFNVPKNFRISALHLEGNPLQILRNNMFLALSGMEQLVLNRLHLQVIFVECFLGLFTLKELEMSHVRLESDPVDFLRNTPALSVLRFKDSPQLAEYLMSSALSSIALIRMNNLTELNLEDNHLTTLDHSIMMLPRLQSLRLAGNHLHCTRDLLWLNVWYMSQPNTLADLNSVICSAPTLVQGHRFLDTNLSMYDSSMINTDVQTNEMNYDYAMTTAPPYVDYKDYYKDYFSSLYNDYNIFKPGNYDYGDTDQDNEHFTTDYSQSSDQPYYYDYHTHPINETGVHEADNTTADKTTADNPTSTALSDNVTTTTQSTNSSDVASTSTIATTHAPVTEPTTESTDVASISTPAVEKSTTTTTNTATTNTTNKKDKKSEFEEGPQTGVTMKNVGIAIAMSVGVIILMLLITAIVLLIWKRKNNVVHHNAREYPKDNYVFIVSKTETGTEVKPIAQRKLTREERGSTTSRASEDITNKNDNSMKVYTLDVDS